MYVWNQKHITQPAICSISYTTDGIDKGLFFKGHPK